MKKFKDYKEFEDAVLKILDEAFVNNVEMFTLKSSIINCLSEKTKNWAYYELEFRGIILPRMQSNKEKYTFQIVVNTNPQFGHKHFTGIVHPDHFGYEYYLTDELLEEIA